MTGIGGGSLMTPMLILVFGVTPVTAIGTDLAYAAVTKTVGGYKHLSQRTVDVRLSSWMAIGSCRRPCAACTCSSCSRTGPGATSTICCSRCSPCALLLTGAATLVRAS